MHLSEHFININSTILHGRCSYTIFREEGKARARPAMCQVRVTDESDKPSSDSGQADVKCLLTSPHCSAPLRVTGHHTFLERAYGSSQHLYVLMHSSCAYLLIDGFLESCFWAWPGLSDQGWVTGPFESNL